MYRNIFTHLVEWRDQTDLLPLLVCAARQVGKTTAVEQFGKE